MPVGQVNLDERDAHSQQRVTYRHAGMRKSRRIDDDEVHAFLAGGVDSLDQDVLGVALEVAQFMAGVTGPALQILVDLLQRGGAVDAGLAGAQQDETGATQNQQGGHGKTLCEGEGGDYAAIRLGCPYVNRRRPDVRRLRKLAEINVLAESSGIPRPLGQFVTGESRRYAGARRRWRRRSRRPRAGPAI